MNNTGNEIEMRQELVEAVGGLLGNLQNDGEIDLTDGEKTQLLTAANIVTLARTAVELDFKRDVDRRPRPGNADAVFQAAGASRPWWHRGRHIP